MSRRASLIRCMQAGAAAVWLAASAPALALPEAFVSATVARWGDPCFGSNCTFSHGGVFGFGLAPFRAAQMGPADGWNSAHAVARFVGASGAAPLVPFQPGSAVLQLGVFASLAQAVTVTQTGLPGDPLLDVLPVHSASASVLYRDQITFSDASLPAGAPISVTLHWGLAGGSCPGGAPCAITPPPGFDRPGLILGSTNAGVALTSRILLPTGPDQVSDTDVHSTGGLVPQGMTGSRVVGALLDHSFTVTNGGTYTYEASAAAGVTLDARDMVDFSQSPPSSPVGTVSGYHQLDYDNTLHLYQVDARRADGQALGALTMVNSFGWALQTSPLPAVPEPATWALWGLGLAALARRMRRAAAPWAWPAPASACSACGPAAPFSACHRQRWRAEDRHRSARDGALLRPRRQQRLALPRLVG